jgi:hypothetical protein
LAHLLPDLLDGAWTSWVIAWTARVNSVFSLSSISASWKSWSALVCWNADCLFWPIMTNVDRRIASRDTMNVKNWNGYRSAPESLRMW